MVGRMVCLALGLWLVIVPGALAQEPVAVVVGQEGSVVARGDSGLRALHMGAPLWAGDVLITHEESRVRVEFEDGGRLTLGPESEAEIAAFAPEGAGTVVELALGIVRALLGGPESGGFEVRSRAAVAAARSTEFIVEADPDNNAVFAAEGTVAVAVVATGEVVSLEAGDGIDIPLDGPAGEVTQWGAPRVEDVLARTRVAFGE